MSLKEFLKEYGISYRQLAKITGIPWGTMKDHIYTGFTDREQEKIKIGLIKHFSKATSKVLEIKVW